MYVVSRNCAISCLRPFLTPPTLDALIAGIHGSSGRVVQVIELYENDQLVDIFNIGPSRASEIRRALVFTGLVAESNRRTWWHEGIRDERPEHDEACGTGAFDPSGLSRFTS
jgi:hypothetical protein